MRIGAHCPISGGFLTSLDYLKNVDGNTLQIFSGSPRMWFKPPIDESEASQYTSARMKMGYSPLIIHASYLINIASPKEDLWRKSLDALHAEIKRADVLSADYLVLHPGSYTTFSKEDGMESIIKALNGLAEIEHSVKLLLENTAGTGHSMGHLLDDLINIKSETRESVAFCLDTAHAFGAGYTPEDMLKHPLALNVEVIHINDSLVEFNSRKDRHAHIGQGQIGLNGLRTIVNHKEWADKPFIIETPWENDQNRLSIARLKSLIQTS
ncbi:deoxyribonuclease IV [Elusimicrobiota bacterium]